MIGSKEGDVEASRNDSMLLLLLVTCLFGPLKYCT